MLRQRCSLSMPHRPCEYMHGAVRLDGLGIPNGHGSFTHIWDRVLLNNPGLKINRHVQGTPPIGHAQSTQPNSHAYIHRLYGASSENTFV